MATVGKRGGGRCVLREKNLENSYRGREEKRGEMERRIMEGRRAVAGQRRPCPSRCGRN